MRTAAVSHDDQSPYAEGQFVPSSRDLASLDLWQISLRRSRHRREIAALHRRHAPRRKGASLAVSAAVATAPVIPSLASADGAGGGGHRPAPTGLDHLPPREAVSLLHFGATGDVVFQLQRALHVELDGIFGPHTRSAVRSFQRRHGMRPTGAVDLRTWIALFHPKVTVEADVSPTPAAPGNVGPRATPESVDVEAPAPTAPVSAGVVAAAPSAHSALASAPGRPAAPAHSQTPVSAASQQLAKIRTPVPGAPAPAGQVPAGQGAVTGSGGAQPVASPRPSRPGSRGGSTLPPALSPISATGQGLIATMTAAADRITSHHYAYSWGGGHNSRFSGPYDCSGAVSAVLHAAGLIKEAMVSGDFMHWGKPGRGEVTIYASPSHVYMSIRGRFFGTTHANPGGGAGWFRGAPRAGFVVVHVPLDRAGRSVRARVALGGLRPHGRRVRTSARNGGDYAPDAGAPGSRRRGRVAASRRGHGRRHVTSQPEQSRGSSTPNRHSTASGQTNVHSNGSVSAPGPAHDGPSADSGPARGPGSVSGSAASAGGAGSNGGASTSTGSQSTSGGSSASTGPASGGGSSSDSGGSRPTSNARPSSGSGSQSSSDAAASPGSHGDSGAGAGASHDASTSSPSDGPGSPSGSSSNGRDTAGAGAAHHSDPGNQAGGSNSPDGGSGSGDGARAHQGPADGSPAHPASPGTASASEASGASAHGPGSSGH